MLAPILFVAILLGAVGCQREPDPKESSARQAVPEIWISPIRSEDPARNARTLLAAFDRAQNHGLEPDDYRPANAAAMLEDAGQSQARRKAANAMLHEAYIRWANDMAAAGIGDIGVIVTDRDALNAPPDPARLADAAGSQPNVEMFLRKLEQRHPLYNRIQATLAKEIARGSSPSRLASLRRNLVRARMLPVEGRHVVVDAGSQRLWLFEKGAIVGQMRVVVGAPSTPTPMMAGMLDHVVVRPYWHVPEDLAQSRIAPLVVAQGLPYLARQGYQVLSDWTDEAVPIEARTIDWKTAAAKRASVRIRQLPGQENMMGQMKFMFANDLGIYLHDTPQRNLFALQDRAHSAGCVRVEDWRLLARWLFEGTVDTDAPQPERAVPLPRRVPLHLTYFTIDVASEDLPPLPDVYLRDKQV